MKKRSNSIIKSVKSQKTDRPKDNPTAPWFDEYKDCFTFTFKPITQAFVDRFSSELIDWAKNDPKALRIQDFHWNKGIEDKTYYRWCEKHETLAAAHRLALNYIGSRREIGALERKYSEAMVIRTLHNYDPTWELNKQRDKQEKIDIAIATMKAREELLKSDRPQVIVLSELEYKKLETQEKV